jgi:hypothetical protein
MGNNSNINELCDIINGFIATMNKQDEDFNNKLFALVTWMENIKQGGHKEIDTEKAEIECEIAAKELEKATKEAMETAKETSCAFLKKKKETTQSLRILDIMDELTNKLFCLRGRKSATSRASVTISKSLHLICPTNPPTMDSQIIISNL